MPNYRQPTEKESKKLNEARKKTSEGIEAEKDMFSKLMPTMAKDARDQIRAGKAMRESVSEAAREGEAYNQAGFNKGGLNKVNPVPSVPATPAKQNPNAVDKDSKKPGAKGFQAILDKHTGGSKRGDDTPDNLRTGGKVSSASKRADGCAIRGKTRA